ncbi:coiled-coil domain-containing protein 66 isoform X3 [Nannospalax galili]|uniref:coiled-coil domain-containing protein 66 isoform X3 n=1 Tax=Nannospalax galili TaxID=1026970 RepID=UPI00111C53D4|nr:coiled-coil domain-containing protein 66 isoform X3 [Nannospalax galili]
MNLGDGLKLETELLDGKTKLILSPYERKSKISVKMGNKIKIAKCPLRTKQVGRILKSTQNTYIGNETHLQKKIIGSEILQANCEKSKLTCSPTKNLCKQYADKDCLHVQKEISPATSNIKKIRDATESCLEAKQGPFEKYVTAENMNSSLVCLTQDQLRQILRTINQGNGSISLIENGKEETSQDNLHLNNIPNQPKDENIIELLQKTEIVSPTPNENKHVYNKDQEAAIECEQKVTRENEWKPAGIFSTLGERERDRSLLEAKRAQWKKELGALFTDEQVALKKKEKEASQKWNNPWKKSESGTEVWDKLDQPREAVLQEQPCSTMKQELQRKWIEELSKQTEDDQQRKTEEKMINSKGEDHDRWAMHFDSLKSHPGSQSRLSSQLTHQHLEYICLSPNTPDLADVKSVNTPPPGNQVESSEEQRAKPVMDVAVALSQKTNFLRSMTALLDPAQIEERERRRQKQLEHQVEEKRRKKQLEEEQRKKEEEEEERRLAREREELQRQYEEDILKQRQKEEIMTLKTNELFHTMQRAQELAQRLKQEQRIRELTQKGHDASGLIKNLGVDTVQVDYKASTNISNSRHDSDEAGGKTNKCISSTTSPKKDTGVQTDDLNLGIFTDALSHYGSVTERSFINFSSPEISAEFNGQFSTKKDKQELSADKGANLEKENSWYNGQCNQFVRPEKQTKLMKKCPKKPAWNINKPLKRYVPASEKYPKQLQKQREEKKVRRQMELLHLVERNHPENLSQCRGTSPEALASPHQETESEIRWHPAKKVEEPLKALPFSKERFQSPPIPALKNRTQQTQTNSLPLPLKSSNYNRENPILGNGQTEPSDEMSEPSHFIPYVRTNEIYYLDPDAPLSRPSTQDNQYQISQDCEQELPDCDRIKDPLLNPKLVKNRDRQQAILKGLSELRQGLLQKQKELETNLLPLTANQEENFSSKF